MTINNSRDYLVSLAAQGLTVTDHLVVGSNVQIDPGTYVPDYDNNRYDSVTFQGTAGRDTLLGGGGEAYSFFLGTRGDDIYGATYDPNDPNAVFSYSLVDYSPARHGVVVDMDRPGGNYTFVDDHGDSRTIALTGMAYDGLGGVDRFMASSDAPEFSSVFEVIGSRFGDVMTSKSGTVFDGGAGNDVLTANSAEGGDGNDRLIAASNHASALDGGKGNDAIYGSDAADFLSGGDFDLNNVYGEDGNDRIFAGGGNDGFVIGQAGNDYIDGGAGNDFIDGGVGRDTLVSGSGSDIINPDREAFQLAPDQARDGDKDVIRVTRDDLGDYNDVVLSRAFEAGRDQIRFADAVRHGENFRVYQEDQSINPDTGQLFRSSDQADLVNTVLQIDQNGDGFGDAASPDTSDYFLVVLDADLSPHHGYLLT